MKKNILINRFVISKEKISIYFKYLFFFFLLFSNLLFSQNKLSTEKSAKFQYYKKLTNDKYKIEEYDHYAKELLINAQTDYEMSYGNFILGDYFYASGQYLIAIQYFEAAQRYGNKLDSIVLKRDYTNGLVMSYRRAGLKEQSNDAWERQKALAPENRDKYFQAQYYYNLSKIYDIDEEYCKSAEAKKKFLQLIPENEYSRRSYFIFGTYSQLAFVQIKCGDTHLAEKNLSKADKLVGSDDIMSYPLYELYALSKALLAYKNDGVDEARSFFDEAYKASKINRTVAITKLILSERIEANLDTPQQQLALSKEINQINTIEKNTTEDITEYETIKSKTEIKNEKYRNTKLIIGFIIALIISIAAIYYYYHVKNKRLKLKFEKIIENIENLKKLNDLPDNKQTISKKTPQNDNELEVDRAIVKQLKSLEQRHFFTDKNLSATQMAVMLKITPRKLSYILQNYRNGDFYSYLNAQRINYITAAYKENPKLRQYKLATIAEMSGYNSYSQFVLHFKAQTGIKPSQYIELLNEQ